MATLPRVLVVDDEPEIRSLLAEFLTGCGYCCEGAGNGREALDRLAHEEFSVVLTDVRMPQMTGIEMLLQLRAQGNQVPVVVMSAHLDDPTLKRAYAMRVRSVVAKPFRLREVKDAVSEALTPVRPWSVSRTAAR